MVYNFHLHVRDTKSSSKLPKLLDTTLSTSIGTASSIFFVGAVEDSTFPLIPSLPRIFLDNTNMLFMDFKRFGEKTGFAAFRLFHLLHNRCSHHPFFPDLFLGSFRFIGIQLRLPRLFR
ncbi:hypothetical protein ERO13_D13G013250v2 [Gossypium hirsutum]|uniref:Uncharacterized protein n=5 Tax=Gossypium TaxID=3633 RepID=A0A0D2S6H6_GOSRA|nr:hypothetical protein ES319_D13G014500v1 [Gossypium barbadense]KAG4109859.1 hypothetical protein ERO13_D13G013250v2 [Gossypium hirsutum]KJB78712.1 hypothetical protein B456_013G014200 [Gossypium raimondii]TYG35842.1 hypothetical protein ES288_D13G015500v1 [Gossypium darwinii]TYH32788.1 hypothetical protein ES332_D13G014200v1 [Gossypium tomentosum]TYI45138.1 hypothetical protein E1A91_D13G015200v1 [Gossypium mustelinum]